MTKPKNKPIPKTQEDKRSFNKDLILVIIPILVNTIFTFVIVNFQSYTDGQKEITRKKLLIVENLSRLDGKIPHIETYFDIYSSKYQLCEPKFNTSTSNKQSEECKNYYESSEKLADFNASMEAELFMLSVFAGPETKKYLDIYMNKDAPFWKKDRDQLHAVISAFAKEIN